ncbi:MAG: hypothetical protein JOY99_00875 [Sphingomonadaceae bacterium]|nr:hypothetical protein [Sphingomonadaceae bacterium]
MISGATRLFAILGDPIAQVRTPELFNALMAARGADAVMVPMHVPAGALGAAVTALRAMPNLGGFVATVPHKVAMLDQCDAASPAARAAGAANAFRRTDDGRIEGEILDGIGFVEGLRRGGVDPKDRDIYLAGAGGAAKAIAFALAEAGARRLRISNRTAERVVEIADRLARAGMSLPVEVAGSDPSGCDLVVNATSLGMTPDDALPLDVTRLTADQIVAEVIMKPAMTPLLREAEARGCRICPGAPMLDCQIELMAAFMGAPR